MPAAPPLLLRFVSAGPIDEGAVRTEVERVTGRTTTATPAAGLGELTVSLQEEADGLPRTVVVTYQPPAGELSRTDVLVDAASAPTRVALLAQALLQRDVGVTVLLAPPKAAPGAGHVPLPEAAAPPSGLSSSDKPAATGAAHDNTVRISPWTIAALFRLGAPSYSYNDGNAFEEGHGPGVGFAARVDAPSPLVLTLGIELYADQHWASAGVNTIYQAHYLGAALVPSIRLSPKDWPIEFRAVAAAGLTLQRISDSRETWDSLLKMKSVPGKLGYRVGASIQGTGWLSEHFGLCALAGFEHSWSYVTTTGSTTTPGGYIERDGWRSRLWSNLPVLQVGAVARL